MDDLERFSIERACARLVTTYCHYVDHGEAARIAELFAEHGEFVSPAGAMRGRDALARGFGRRQALAGRSSRHVCSNLLIDVVDAGHAEGSVYLTLYRHDGEAGRRVSPLDGQPQLVGEYRDRFVRTPDGWRFAQRDLRVHFARGVTQ